MGRKPPAWALKYIEHEEQPGDVPDTGATPPCRVRGSIIPEIVPSRQIPDVGSQWKGLIAEGEVVEPPFNPWLLVSTALESDTLGPAIEAYATNVGGFGADLIALFDTEDPETGERLDPPAEATAEKTKLSLFLETACMDGALEDLLYMVDQDVEETGNGYVEVLRNRLGEVAALGHAPSWTMRLGRLSQPVLVEQPVRHPETGEIVILPRWRRFRTIIQIRENRVVYFKQFGDPRVMNRRTGQVRESGSWGVDENGNALDTTEVRHFKIYASWTPYGIPRWLGAMPQIRAGRSTGELLADWFDSAPIGAKLAMVAGGVWSQESLKKAMGQIDDLARGIENAWTIIALEAEPRNFTGDPLDANKEQRPQIQLEDLAVKLPAELYQGSDSLWEMTRGHVRGMFRLPPIYFGSSDDYTRATASTAVAFTEEQVFVPLRRRRWGAFFNTELLPSLAINYWKIALRGANTADDSELPISELTAGGGASPNALIDVFNEMTGQERQKITEPWADRPLALVLELVKLKLNPNKPLEELVGELQAREEEARAEARERLEQRRDETDPTEVTQKGIANALDVLRSSAAVRLLIEEQIETNGGSWFA